LSLSLGLRGVSFSPQSGEIFSWQFVGCRASQLTHESFEMLLDAGSGMVVLYVIVLVALAAISGFMLGQLRLRWAALAAVALAFLSAFVFRRIQLNAGVGIPAVAAVLAINHAAYLIGLMARAEASDPYLMTKSTRYQTMAAMMTFATNMSTRRASGAVCASIRRWPAASRCRSIRRASRAMTHPQCLRPRRPERGKYRQSLGHPPN
jgi:hypothetical protein